MDYVSIMSKENPIITKSFAFAVRIVKLAEYLRNERKEYVLSKQVLRSGTSIGANIEEAHGAQSDRDFFAKISVAYKEARETHYWLRLLRETNYLNDSAASSILADCEQIVKLAGTIKNTMEKKLNS